MESVGEVTVKSKEGNSKTSKNSASVGGVIFTVPAEDIARDSQIAR